MKKITFLFILLPAFCFCQIQIGEDIDGITFDRFGSDVSLSSDGIIVAIGSEFGDGSAFNSGYVRVLENVNNNWVQLGGDINGDFVSDLLGYSVSLSSDGTIVAMGAPFGETSIENSGYVKIFQYQNNSWMQLGSTINGEAFNDQFGRNVSLSSDGTILAISAIGNDINSTDSGYVRVFEYQNSNWVPLGNPMYGEYIYDRSGVSLDLSSDGSIVAIGAADNSSSNYLAFNGHVRVYKYQGNQWMQLGTDIDGEFTTELSAQSVSLSSDGFTLAVGSILDDANGVDSGSVAVYNYTNTSWQQIGADIPGETLGDRSGWSVSLSSDGSIVAIGATLNDGNGSDSGQARIYKNENNVWIQKGNDIDGEAEDDNFGNSIVLSPDGLTLAVGGYINSENGIGAGHVRIYDLTDALSIDELQNFIFQLYPNPTKNQFTIQLNNSSILEKVTIYNTLGQAIFTSKNTVVDTSKLASGSYIIEITTNTGKAAKKLIIE
ncbi:T9SS type A sorting domain-containing protein [Psychroserpens sp.]